MSIRTLIVDDEPLARERLRTLVLADPELALVGESADGAAAVAAITELSPDLVFLDVQMPEIDGCEVLRRVGPGAVPVVVFVTAFDHYAVEAFELSAVDYLLKPFDRDRFGEALARAKVQLASQDRQALRRQLDDLLEALHRTYLDRLVVEAAGRITFLRVEEIEWIEAQGNYVKVHAGGQAPLLRRSLSQLTARLDPARFVRIHRSTVVNLDCVVELTPEFHGELRVRLRDGTELVSNRSFRQNLRRLFPDGI